MEIREVYEQNEEPVVPSIIPPLIQLNSLVLRGRMPRAEVEGDMAVQYAAGSVSLPCHPLSTTTGLSVRRLCTKWKLFPTWPF
ncbi:hypothetical protein HanIR_Chr13g0633891 [Helianthus annuus]|nr:hypothetical protein HanIR_Chr13g0633891 [Helianthus annuus]